jgi:beta-1,3-N-acetylgalactosaminyltransferase 2
MWVVNLFGKWKERDYDSATYPPFACGSGYVIGKALVDTLVRNRGSLVPFQGEDVSMGIWLSPFHHKRFQDDRWLCSKKDLALSPNFFISVPDLDEQDMSKLSSTFK